MTGGAYIPSADQMELCDGSYLSVLSPEDGCMPGGTPIRLEVIAHHLSQLCRYAGATTRFYSVAEHAVLVSRRLRAQGYDVSVQLAGLHHDDAEAFLGDVGSALKRSLSNYDVLETNMMSAIKNHLGLAHLPFDHRAIKEADLWALSAEAYFLMPSRGFGWRSDGLFDPDEVEASEDPHHLFTALQVLAGFRFRDMHDYFAMEHMALQAERYVTTGIL